MPARKKKKFKLTKAQKKRAKAIAIPALIGLTCLLLGMVATRLLSGHKPPANIVWASESSVKVPNDLKKFLLTRDNCQHYRGTGTPAGVGLWGVYQVTDAKYAKIAYGCSWNLDSYIMAIKQPKGWYLIPPAEYFAVSPSAEANQSRGFLPLCSQLEKYKIPRSSESFCMTADGKAQANTL